MVPIANYSPSRVWLGVADSPLGAINSRADIVVHAPRPTTHMGIGGTRWDEVGVSMRRECAAQKNQRRGSRIWLGPISPTLQTFCYL